MSSPTPSTVKTTVAILVSKTSKSDTATSDPYHSQRLQVVVWASRRDAATSRYVAEYYQFWDHPSRWNHLDALLTRLAPLEAIHVGSADCKQLAGGGNNSSNRLPKALSRLMDTLQNRTDLTAQDAASAADTNASAAEAPLPCWHDTVPALQKDRLDSVVTQLLAGKSDVLAYQGDTELSGDTVTAKGLVFFLNAAGIWSAGGVDESLSARWTLRAGVLDSHLVLDRTAAAAIHLWPPSNAGQAVVVGGQAHTNSLFGMLAAACRCNMGKRLLESWLRQPLVDLAAIQARQDAVATLVQNGVGRDAVREQALQTLASTDLTKLAAHLAHYEERQGSGGEQEEAPAASKGMGSTRSALQSLYQLYLVAAQKIPLVTEHLQSVMSELPQGPDGTPDTSGAGLLPEIMAGLTSCNAELQRSVCLVEAVLDLDQAPREYLVRAEYKDELVDIREELDQLEVDLEDCHKEMNESWAQAAGISNSNAVRLDRGDSDSDWQFRLPDTNDSKILTEQLGNAITVYKLKKNGVIFTTKQLRELSCKKQDLVAEYDRLQREVVMDAMKVAASYQAVLERSSELVATLDVISALAHIAAYSPHGYCRPTMTDSEEDGMGIDLKGARHPCVELQQDMEFIPNDSRLVFGDSSFLLVTGPNMGGKSTYIRALGAIVTLAQIGSYVPCTSATINICHHILARVGAGDLQEKGISTFMAEMLESSSILRTASKRSLIIVDELGRGTSTFDGYGLARAISEYIVEKIGCMTGKCCWCVALVWCCVSVSMCTMSCLPLTSFIDF